MPFMACHTRYKTRCDNITQLCFWRGSNLPPSRHKQLAVKLDCSPHLAAHSIKPFLLRVGPFAWHYLGAVFGENVLPEVGFEPTRTSVHWNLSPTP